MQVDSIQICPVKGEQVILKLTGCFALNQMVEVEVKVGMNEQLLCWEQDWGANFVMGE